MPPVFDVYLAVNWLKNALTFVSAAGVSLTPLVDVATSNLRGRRALIDSYTQTLQELTRSHHRQTNCQICFVSSLSFLETALSAKRPPWSAHAVLRFVFENPLVA